MEGETARRREALEEALRIIADLEARGALGPNQAGWRREIEAALARLGDGTR